jgi:hypothetical protein
MVKFPTIVPSAAPIAAAMALAPPPPGMGVLDASESVNSLQDKSVNAN